MTEWTQEAMEKRLVRYADLKGLRNAFIDARTPGSDQKENFTIIGPGVSENPAQVVHIPEAHGFNVGAARQPFGCTNSQHSHLTAETFVVRATPDAPAVGLTEVTVGGAGAWTLTIFATDGTPALSIRNSM